MLDRHVELYGKAPRLVAADGGYASGANLEAVKAMGVTDMAFNQKRGLSIMDMVKSSWVYRKLENFRAGIEGNISCLKRAYGLDRCTWKGLEHFRCYVWSSVVSYNLTLHGSTDSALNRARSVQQSIDGFTRRSLVPSLSGDLIFKPSLRPT